MAAYDSEFWEARWRGAATGGAPPANPYLGELAHLAADRALDAGCGEGAEAIWLAARGWTVTGADISGSALRRAAATAEAAGVEVEWIEADLASWRPATPFPLVTSFYAHPSIPQLAFYARLADWVAPGGTLLVVGHGGGHGHEGGHGHGDAHGPDPAVAVTPSSVSAILTRAGLDVETAREHDRVLASRSGRPVPLRDVIVRATRPH